MDLTKDYPNGEKILDANGNWVDNPNFLAEGTHRSDMTNVQDLVYYGDVYFWKQGAEQPEKLQVIMDTGSSWLWAPSSI